MSDKVSFKERLSFEGETELVIEAVPVIQDIELIKLVSEEATIDEAEKIWPVLDASLDPKLGYGLSAIQIGIPKRVAFVRYAGKEYRLLNTRIIEKHNLFVMPGEGCLSIPGKHVNTQRYQNIVIDDDMLGRVAVGESVNGLLTVIFQHEVDHFNGITILDRKQQPIKNTTKIGRNDPCPCGSGKKYKKCCGN